jgi:hypothetical protein
MRIPSSQVNSSIEHLEPVYVSENDKDLFFDKTLDSKYNRTHTEKNRYTVKF